jgi:3,4-dihydroxy-2-butanone 4-phosphate synthase
MNRVQRRLTALAVGLVIIISVNHVQAAATNISAAQRASAIRTCSVLSSYKPPEHISTTIPYYTYSACMTKRHQKL